MAIDAVDAVDDVEMLETLASPVVVALISVLAPAGIDPDSAALLITQGANTFGPYPAILTTNPDGTSSLSVSFSVLPIAA